MQAHVEAQRQKVLRHLYINPLEKCNLKCKICYTRKTDPILSNDQILDFVQRYQAVQKLDTITFCGGEVFALATFPSLLNILLKQGLFLQVITNGTIDRLDDLTNPNMVNLIVSLDGTEPFHDANRGEGNFRRSVNFMKKAHSLGFHLDVFSIITKQNLPHIDEFEASLTEELGFLPGITYHPRKPPSYLLHHPVSNIEGQVEGFDYLSKSEMMQVMRTRNVFPPRDLGCYQVAVASDGRVYGCCEGYTPLGRMEDSIEGLISALTDRLEVWEAQNEDDHCLGCSQAEFMCGIKEYLSLLREAERQQPITDPFL